MTVSYTADQFAPYVVKNGGNVVDKIHYFGDGSTTFRAGDLIRITTSGQIKLAAFDTDTAGAVHGMILTDDYATTAPTTSTQVEVMLFAEDTVLAIQVDGDTPANASVGTTYILNRDVAGRYNMPLTDTKGIATVVGKPVDDKNYDPYADDSLTNGIVYISFAQSILDGRSA